MPAIKEGEILTPFGGLSDTHVVGEGLLDFTKAGKEYMALSLDFAEETAFLLEATTDEGRKTATWAEVEISNNREALVDFGYTAEEIRLSMETANALTELLKLRIKKGHPYV